MRAAFANRRAAALCALLLALCVLATYPLAEVGANDDFAYTYSAKRLAETGHIFYCGWSSAMLGWQLALGALFIKIFGFSFTIARVSVLLVGTGTAFLLQRLYVRLGLNQRNATFGTLAMVLSPLFIPLSFSFMTDVPALLGIVLCLYACVRSLQSDENGASQKWLAVAIIASALLGTARQTVWLGALAIVPPTVWLLRRRGLKLVPLGALWAASVAFMLGCLYWFSHQLYTTHEGVAAPHKPNHRLEVAVAIVQAVLELAFFLCPVLMAYVGRIFKGRRVFPMAAVVGIWLVVAGLLFLRPNSYMVEILRAPSVWIAGSYVTPQGTLQTFSIGQRPLQLSVTVRDVLTLFIALSALAFAAFLLLLPREKPAVAETAEQPTNHRLLVLLGPFTLSYLLFLSIRLSEGAIVDRYLIPLLAVFTFAIVWIYQKRVDTHLPPVTWAVLTVFALYGVASTHDLFATERARLAAIGELQSAGLPRDAYYGTFGYNGWTQVEEAGYMNTGGIGLPPGAKPFQKAPDWDRPCGYDMSIFSVIHAKYAISYDTKSCEDQSTFPAVPYRLWLPPFRAAIYIRRVPP